MKGKYLYLTVLLGILMLPSISEAQFIVDYKKDGDRFFENKNYYAASVYYQKALKLLPEQDYYHPYNLVGKAPKVLKKNAEKFQYLVYKLGQSFRLYKDYKSAEGWYEKVLKFDNQRFPLARLWYGICLRADGRYQEAVRELETFKEHYSGDDQYIERADLEIASGKYAVEQLRYPRLAKVKKLPEPVNVDQGSDYAAWRVGDTLIFTSSRRNKHIDSSKHNPYVNKLYMTVLEGEVGASSVTPLQVTNNKLTEEAAASVDTKGSPLYFTEWQGKGGKKDADKYKISKSVVTAGGNYENPILLAKPVNVDGYNTKEAQVTSDGKYLIFSSDRPGGEGGYDLWFCSLDANGDPVGEAVNLGSTINTKQDEVNPFYDQTSNRLVFSSNGRVGMGGFDLYKSRGRLADNDWSAPQNMEYPVNSSKDDNYYHPIEENKKHFYISSDRNSVCCLDLYSIQLQKIRLIGHAYEEGSNKPIKNVQAVLIDSISGEKIGEMTTKENGFFHFPLTNRKPLKMHFYNKVYGTKDLTITNVQLKQVDSVYEQNVYFKLVYNKPIRIQNVYYDFDKANLRPESKPALDTLVDLLKDHSKWIVEIGSHTDSIGSNKYNLWLSQRRAQSVVDYLLQHGIDKSRLQAKGYGETRPIAPNSKPDGSDNPRGRQLNRRTEFTILGKIKQKGKKLDHINSHVGNKEEIKVDQSKKLHLSGSKSWIKNR